MGENKKAANPVLKYIGNNIIVFLLLAVAVFVGITRDNFFSMSNFNNLAANTAVRFLIALGVSGCLITKGTDLSRYRLVRVPCGRTAPARRLLGAAVPRPARV
mgnify:CR=1 FL=1